MPVVGRPAPTVGEIAANGDKVILLSHFGRPKQRNAKDSLKPIATALEKHIGAQHRLCR
jgi:phosphoglycerate kinase